MFMQYWVNFKFTLFGKIVSALYQLYDTIIFMTILKAIESCFNCLYDEADSSVHIKVYESLAIYEHILFYGGTSVKIFIVQ